MPLLKLKRVCKTFGGLVAVRSLDMSICEHEFVGLIGPNGAGKTTVFSLISGFHRITKGEILFRGEHIGKLRHHEVVQKGIARTFQSTVIFRKMSVVDNVILGSHLYGGLNSVCSLLPSSLIGKRMVTITRRGAELLSLAGLEGKSNAYAEDLCHREQKVLQIVIAMASGPKLLLLDEPVAGMNPEEVGKTMRFINKLREFGVAILLIEHNMKAVMDHCERIIVLNYGSKIAEGPPGDVRRDENVIKAYLGGSDTNA